MGRHGILCRDFYRDGNYRLGLGFRDIAPNNVDSHEKNKENETETGIMYGDYES